MHSKDTNPLNRKEVLKHNIWYYLKTKLHILETIIYDKCKFITTKKYQSIQQDGIR